MINRIISTKMIKFNYTNIRFFCKNNGFDKFINKKKINNIKNNNKIEGLNESYKKEEIKKDDNNIEINLNINESEIKGFNKFIKNNINNIKSNDEKKEKKNENVDNNYKKDIKKIIDINFKEENINEQNKKIDNSFNKFMKNKSKFTNKKINDEFNNEKINDDSKKENINKEESNKNKEDITKDLKSLKDFLKNFNINEKNKDNKFTNFINKIINEVLKEHEKDKTKEENTNNKEEVKKDNENINKFEKGFDKFKKNKDNLKTENPNPSNSNQKENKNKEKTFNYKETIFFNKKEKENDKNEENNTTSNWIKIIVMILLIKIVSYIKQNKRDEIIDYLTFFKNYLEPDNISKLEIVYNSNDDGLYYLHIYSKNNELKRLLLPNVDNFIENLEDYLIENNRELISVIFTKKIFSINDFFFLSSKLVLEGLYLYILYLTSKNFKLISDFAKRLNTKNVSKNFSITKPNIKFNDVAGLKNPKIEIQEFVNFLKNSEKYEKLGAKMPKGALLTGPPGTGKTLLSKATAGEADCNFFYASGSEFVEKYVGTGSKRMRELFDQAKLKSPSIIFIDEIDAIGKKRLSNSYGNSEKENTLNQLLVEMDGFKTRDNVIVLAATNRPDTLDNALKRPGRFDREINIDVPDINERKEILKIYLKKVKIDETKEVFIAEKVSGKTPGFSGADLANVVNEAAILAARKDLNIVEDHFFDEALEKVIGGLEKTIMLSEEEKTRIAIHESGHAVVSWMLEYGMPLLKLSIIPRTKGALGYAQYLPNESGLQLLEELEESIIFILGGRLAELKFLNSVSNGAADDLNKAYRIAYEIVTKYSMIDSLKNVSHKIDSNGSKLYSIETNNKIDKEVKNIIDRCEIRCKEIIEKNENNIIKLKDELLKNESIEYEKIVELIGEKSFENNETYKDYFEKRKLSFVN